MITPAALKRLNAPRLLHTNVGDPVNVNPHGEVTTDVLAVGNETVWRTTVLTTTDNHTMTVAATDYDHTLLYGFGLNPGNNSTLIVALAAAPSATCQPTGILVRPTDLETHATNGTLKGVIVLPTGATQAATLTLTTTGGYHHVTTNTKGHHYSVKISVSLLSAFVGVAARPHPHARPALAVLASEASRCGQPSALGSGSVPLLGNI